MTNPTKFTRGCEQQWQREPARLTTDYVQVWSANGGMITAQMPLATAQDMVRDGKVFIISEQAIGHFDSECEK